MVYEKSKLEVSLIIDCYFATKYKINISSQIMKTQQSHS